MVAQINVAKSVRNQLIWYMDKSYKSTSWDIFNTLLNNVIYIYIYIYIFPQIKAICVQIARKKLKKKKKNLNV